MADFYEILSGVVSEFHFVPYLIAAGIILLIFMGIWLMVRSAIQTPIARKAFLSLIFALAFAPSVFGFDMGAFTVPAILMLFIGAIGGLRFVGIIFAITSILTVWAVIFGAWCLISFYRSRSKKIFPENAKL